MHKLMDYVCEEIEKLERKVEREGKLSMAETQYLDLLSHTKKNMLKAEEMSGEDGYSMAYTYEGDMNHSGNSYRSYAGRRGNVRRDSMGRYSSNMGGYSYGNDEFVTQLEDMMEDAPEGLKQDIQRLIKKAEKM